MADISSSLHFISSILLAAFLFPPALTILYRISVKLRRRNEAAAMDTESFQTNRPGNVEIRDGSYLFCVRGAAVICVFPRFLKMRGTMSWELVY